jgi:hypothetical protein
MKNNQSNIIPINLTFKGFDFITLYDEITNTNEIFEFVVSFDIPYAEKLIEKVSKHTVEDFNFCSISTNSRHFTYDLLEEKQNIVKLFRIFKKSDPEETLIELSMEEIIESNYFNLDEVYIGSNKTLSEFLKTNLHFEIWENDECVFCFIGDWDITNKNFVSF